MPSYHAGGRVVVAHEANLTGGLARRLWPGYTK